MRQLGEIGFEDVDAMLLERLMRHTGTAGSAVTRAKPPVAPQLREGGPLRMTNKDGGATDFVPTQLPSLWKTPQGGIARLDGVTNISMATVRRRNRSEPHAPAVVIDISVYRAQRRAGFGLGEHYRIHPI